MSGKVKCNMDAPDCAASLGGGFCRALDTPAIRKGKCQFYQAKADFADALAEGLWRHIEARDDYIIDKFYKMDPERLFRLHSVDELKKFLHSRKEIF